MVEANRDVFIVIPVLVLVNCDVGPWFREDGEESWRHISVSLWARFWLFVVWTKRQSGLDSATRCLATSTLGD